VRCQRFLVRFVDRGDHVLGRPEHLERALAHHQHLGGDAERARLDLVHIGADAGAGIVNRSRRNLRSLPAEQRQLGTMGEEARRSRLVLFDMREVVAQDRTVGRTERCEREAIGGGAGRDPQEWLYDGDVIEATVEGIGTITNTVRDLK